MHYIGSIKEESNMKKADKKYRQIYPNIRYLVGARRGAYIKSKNLLACTSKRREGSGVVPKSYSVCNTATLDSKFELNVLEGALPKDINGNMYICQCLGTPGTYMVGDTNLVKITFKQGDAAIENKLMWSPVAIARAALRRTKHRFDHMGVMFMAPGLGMFSYTEGVYLLPDGRLAITSDVDRPWIVERNTLAIKSPIGKRKEWLPMMAGDAGDAMGSVFAGYSNSHVAYTDIESGEVFFVNYQYKQPKSTNPCYLLRWDGKGEFEKWAVVNEQGENIRVMQSIHELIFTRDYIILADTAFLTGAEILSPWKNAPLPNTKTVVYIVDRRHMQKSGGKLVAKRIEIDEACIHLTAEYENPNDVLSIYMLHTPATNTAEIIRSYDKDMYGRRFAEHVVGYGTLPVLDISSVGKHVVDAKNSKVITSEYIRDKRCCWGPYMYTYMGRQTRALGEQDFFVMFKGFQAEMLPKRIYNAYKDVKNRRVALKDMFVHKTVECNNSIARIDKKNFGISDMYELPDKVLLFTISCIETGGKSGGYLLAGIARDAAEGEASGGHEYWIFKADKLSDGPICKLGHKMLNNSILFHTLYLTQRQEKELDKKIPEYAVEIREDYPLKELERYGPEVKQVFKDVIYPYFEDGDKAKKQKVEHVLAELAKRRVAVHAGNEHIILKKHVGSGKEFSQRLFEEAQRMMATTGWRMVAVTEGVLVEMRPTEGKKQMRGPHATRACGMVNIDADRLFAYIASQEGRANIACVGSGYVRKCETLKAYKGAARCRMAVTHVVDTEKKLFALKLVLRQNSGAFAAIVFVIKVEPMNKSRCKVMCISHAGMPSSGMVTGFLNTKKMYADLYSIMHKAAEDME